LKLNLRIIGVFVILLSMLSCTENSLVNEIKTVGANNWEVDDIKEFNFEVKDTISGYDFFLLVRNNEDYPYRNLYLFVNLEFPNNKIARDTVYCEMASKEGRWLGKGIGSQYNSEILYKINQQFPMKGQYKITLQQGMRKEILPGITNAGVSIRKNK